MLVNQDNVRFTNETFRTLKTVCDLVVQSPSVNNMERWMVTVDAVNDVAFRKLWTYATFPFQYHLCRHNDKNPSLHSSVLSTLLQCLKKAMSKTFIDNVELFIQLNKLLTNVLTENAETVTLKELPEDVKFAVIDCLYTLHKNLHEDVVREIYNPEKKFHIFHAHCVYICVQLAKHEGYVNLRALALKCVLAIIRVYGSESSSEIDAKTKSEIAETIASILPGLVSMYYFIVTSSSILHHDLYLLSLEVFGASIALVFEDSSSTTGEEENLLNVRTLTLRKKSNSASTNIIRSEEWLEKTAEKLLEPAKTLLSLCNNNHWKVRLEVANMAEVMLSKCCDRYLMSVLSILFEALIILSRDNMEQVRVVAQKFLYKLLEKDSLKREKFFASFKERLFNLLISITSALNSISENVLLSQLNLLNGYIRILNSRHLLKSSIYLETLFLTFTKVVRFDASTVTAISNIETTDLSSINFSEQPSKKISWRNMKYLSYETEMVVKNICSSISENLDIDVESLILHLLNALENQPKNRKEIIYLINNVIFNVQFDQNSLDLVRLCTCIINTYLDSPCWSIPICLTNEDNDIISASSIHSNIIQSCLLIEGIGNIALCLKEKFKPLLMHSLYKVIEKAGCPNESIRLGAMETLQCIARACHYPGVTELIADNVDYITNTVSWKLRNLRHNIAVFDVFCVIISFSRQNSLSLLLDIMKILLEGNDLLQDVYCEGFLRVFKSFTVKLRSWFSPIFRDDQSSINETNEKYFQYLLGLSLYIDRLKNEKERSMLPTTVAEDRDIDLNDIFKSNEADFLDVNFNSEESNVTNEQSDENIPNDGDEEDEKIPPHIELVVSVGDNILHALASSNIPRKALILDILADILLILSDKENQLLPLVHKIWSPLTNRLKYDSTDPLIMRRCFQLLCIMAVTSGDFIRKRALNDVLPLIIEFLSSSANESILKDKHSIYRASQKYKFQLMLLNELGSLAVHVRLQEKEIYSILVAATPYLSTKQPLPLQDACVSLFTTIRSYNEDFVWIYLMSISPPETVMISPHSDQFQSIRLVVPENSSYFKKNIIRILNVET